MTSFLQNVDTAQFSLRWQLLEGPLRGSLTQGMERMLLLHLPASTTPGSGGRLGSSKHLTWCHPPDAGCYCLRQTWLCSTHLTLLCCTYPGIFTGITKELWVCVWVCLGVHRRMCYASVFICRRKTVFLCY